MSISILRAKWEKEKSYYSQQEVGSGSQKFVKEVLKSNSLFNLKEGLLSTPIESREKEFIEELSKSGNKADVIIFINSEMIIPVEIERYLNINAGIDQIIKYQLDWGNQRHGILTDGNTWRFYNNNIYEEFTLDQMFQNPPNFKSFWEGYTKSDEYYSMYFNSIVKSEIYNGLSVEKNKELYFEDTTKLIHTFKSKLDIAGYFDAEKKNQKEKKSIEITYAYLIQFILYKVLVDNHFGDFYEDYIQRMVSITNSLNNGNSYVDPLTKIQGISNIISDKVYRPFHEEQKYISQTLNKIIYNSPSNTISDVSPWLDILLYIAKYDYSNIETDIFGILYENYLKEQFEEKDMGQFFTDPSIANFMLNEMGYNKAEINNHVLNNSEMGISIVDPSCGSGTFLYNAVEKIISSFKKIQEPQKINVQELILNNVFGFDIAEFPLYLAEMNIVMRLLPFVINEPPKQPLKDKIKLFKTKDSVAEFINVPLYNAKNDLSDEQLDINKILLLDYKSYIRDEDQLKNLKESLHQNENIPRRRFDYVIGNPPYISYNKCSELLTFKLIKSKKIKLNNIYGVNLHSIPGDPKRYRPNPNLYTFFLALGIALLKDNGRLCYIVPMTMLVNSDLDVIRYHISHYTTINKIITFQGKMFINRGIKHNKEIATSSMILVLTRKKSPPKHKVKIVNYIGDTVNVEEVLSSINENKFTLSKEVLQKELMNNINNWLYMIKSSIEEENFIKLYNEMTPIDLYSNHISALENFNNKFFFDGGYAITEKDKLVSPPESGQYYKIPILNNDYWTIKFFKGYWKNNRINNEYMNIQLRQANQGYSFLDSKYKIIWQYNKFGNFFFTDQKLIWALNKYLGIGSDNKSEMLYLFATLNSRLTKYILDKKVILENEDRRTSLLSLRSVKVHLRMPKITSKNDPIKKQVQLLAEEIINIEETILEDCIDFKSVYIQKFTNIYVKNDNLHMENGNKKINLKIIKNNLIVQKVIAKITGLPISLKDLKEKLIIDKDKQISLKNHLDDLVFILYFIDHPVDHNFIYNAQQTKGLCREHPFYNFISKNNSNWNDL